MLRAVSQEGFLVQILIIIYDISPLPPERLLADSFIPAAAVDQARLEIKQMEDHYTPGERKSDSHSH